MLQHIHIRYCICSSYISYIILLCLLNSVELSEVHTKNPYTTRSHDDTPKSRGIERELTAKRQRDYPGWFFLSHHQDEEIVADCFESEDTNNDPVHVDILARSCMFHLLRLFLLSNIDCA